MLCGNPLALTRSIQQRIDKLFRVERPQVFERLTDADKAQRNRLIAWSCGAQVRYGADHAAFRSAVQLGEHESGDPHRRVERFDLTERVLAGVRIEHK